MFQKFFEIFSEKRRFWVCISYPFVQMSESIYQRKDGLRHSGAEAEDVKIQFLIGEIWTRG